MSEVLQEFYTIVGSLEEAGKDNVASKQKDFNKLIDAMQSPNAAVRAYVSQAVPEFAQYFPSEIAKVVQQQLVLCEDTDETVRSSALRGVSRLPSIIPASESNLITDVSYVIFQLVAHDQDKDRPTLAHVISSMIKNHYATCLASAFTLINSPELQDISMKLVELVKEKFFHPKSDVLTDENRQIAIDQLKSFLATNPPMEVFRACFIELVKLAPITKETAPTLVPEYTQILFTYGGISTSADVGNLDFPKLSIVLNLAKRNIYSKAAYNPDFYTLASIPTLVSFAVDIIFPYLANLSGEETTLAQVQTAQILATVFQYVPGRHCNQRFNAILSLFRTIVSPDSEHPYTCASELVEVILFLVHHLGSYAPDTFQNAVGIDMKIGQPFADSLDKVLAKKTQFLDLLKALATYTKSTVEANNNQNVEIQNDLKPLSAKIKEATEKNESTEDDETKKAELNNNLKKNKAQNKVLASILNLASELLAEKPQCTRFGRAVLSFDGSAKNENTKKDQKKESGNKKDSATRGPQKRRANESNNQSSKRSRPNNRDSRDSRGSHHKSESRRDTGSRNSQRDSSRSSSTHRSSSQRRFTNRR